MIKSIETIYKGYHFRSRLEARWAVFFDALKIEWEYEKEGFELSDGTRYLPDFYLPDFGFIEIKGKYPTDEEQNKIELLVEETKIRGYIFWGAIPEPIPEDQNWKEFTEGAIAIIPFDSQEYGVIISWDMSYEWCICPLCGKIGIEYEGRAGRICHHDDNDKNYNWNDLRLNNAYQSARSARFEYGENGGIKE